MKKKEESIWSKIRTFSKAHPLLTGLMWMALVGIIFINLAMMFLASWTHHGEEIIVPEIKSFTYASAQTELQKSGLIIEISDSVYNTSVPPGTVIESWPKSGTPVKKGRKIYVTISAFSAKMVEIGKAVEGVSVRQAVSYLNARGIKSIRFVEVPSQFPDLVLSATHEGKAIRIGQRLPVNASVVLEVGVSAEPVDSLSTDEELIEEIEF